MAYRHTTIGATMFHFRVRNGTGWFHRAMVTRNRVTSFKFAVSSGLDAELGVSRFLLALAGWIICYDCFLVLVKSVSWVLCFSWLVT